MNEHIVTINDRDMGEVIKRIKVPTGKSTLYVLMYMEVQTSGSLRIGEVFRLGSVEFEVTGMSEGWYQVSTQESLAKSVEIWTADMEIVINRIHCKSQ